MRLKQLTAMVMVAALTVLSGCGGAMRNPAVPGLSIEGQVAVAGRQVIAAVSSAADGIDQLITQQVLTREQGVAVLQQLRLVGTESQRLADVLLIVDATADAAAKQTAIRQAAEIIRGVQRGITQAIVPVGTEEGRSKVAALLSVIGDALVAVSLILPAPGGAAVLPADQPVAWVVDFRPAFA